MNNIFKIAFKYVYELRAKSEILDSKKNQIMKNFQMTSHCKNKSLVSKTTTNEFLTFSNEGLLQNKYKEENTEKHKYINKMDIPFKQILFDFAYPILKDLSKTPDSCSLHDNNRQEMLLEVKKSLYYWKRNPENNERDLRKELNAPKENNLGNKRSLLGLKAESTEWIENFNIGSIMHMNPVKYDEFSYFGDLNYEISKNQLLEKVNFFFFLKKNLKIKRSSSSQSAFLQLRPKCVSSKSKKIPQKFQIQKI